MDDPNADASANGSGNGNVPLLRYSAQERAQIAAARTAAREKKCLEVYGTLQPTKTQIVGMLSRQVNAYGARVPDLGQTGNSELLARALVSVCQPQ